MSEKKLRKKFLLLQSNYMSYYMLNDIVNMDNVVICHRKRAFKNSILNFLFSIHTSGRIQRYIDLPFKNIWDNIIFDKIIKKSCPDYIVFTTSWHSNHLIDYFRKKCENSKLILRFTDTIGNALGPKSESLILNIKNQYDGVLVYCQEDAEKYNLSCHSAGYSKINQIELKPRKTYDVVFIGADKGRIEKIRQAYKLFISAGLSCFFYVIMVKERDRKDDGIIYADKAMSFIDYLSYEMSAKCLFEIVQEGSSGRTYRMMESIIYNKLLITNCKEILSTDYYNSKYVQLYNEVSEIDTSFISNCPNNLDFHYKGDFSPTRVLESIEKKW